MGTELMKTIHVTGTKLKLQGTEIASAKTKPKGIYNSRKALVHSVCVVCSVCIHMCIHVYVCENYQSIYCLLHP